MAEISSAAHVDAGATIGADVTIGAGAVVGPGTILGAGVAIGCNSVVHAGVRLGAGCVIEDLVVLGKRPRLRRGSSAARVELGDLELGPEVTVCSGAVVYAGRHDRCELDHRRPGTGARGLADRAALGRRPCFVRRLQRRRGGPRLDPDRRLRDQLGSRRRRRLPRPGRADDQTTTRMGRHPKGERRMPRWSAARLASAAPRCWYPASRSARRRSSAPARSSLATWLPARSLSVYLRERYARLTKLT